MTRRALYQSTSRAALIATHPHAAGQSTFSPFVPFETPAPGALVRAKGFSTLRDGAYTVKSIDGGDIEIDAPKLIGVDFAAGSEHFGNPE